MIVICTLWVCVASFLSRSSLEVQFHQKTADHDEFTLIIPDDALDTFEGYILEKSKYVIGKTVTIRLHRFGEIRQTFTGIITKLINKKENSYGDLHIIGYAPTILMEHGLECQSFENKNLSQIVKEISQEYPSELVIDTDYLNLYNKENNLSYTVQYKETDYQFLKRLAKRHGEFLYYNGEKVMMGSKTEKIVLLEDGRDLINVEIELNTKPQHFQYKTYDGTSGSVLQSNSQNESDLFSKNNPFQDRAYNASNQIFRKKPKSFHSQTSRDLQNSINK
jgi:type VI secretion system secreted protein VgrG